MHRHRIDLVAAAAALLAVAALATYVAIMRQQDDTPVGWVVLGLALGALGAGYGSVTTSPYRRVVLLVSSAVLWLLGLLSILSIGLLVLAAAALCLTAAVRRPAAQVT